MKVKQLIKLLVKTDQDAVVQHCIEGEWRPICAVSIRAIAKPKTNISVLKFLAKIFPLRL